MQANLEGSIGWQLSEADYERISSIDFQLRLVDGIRFLSPGGPFRCVHLIQKAPSPTPAQDVVWGKAAHVHSGLCTSSSSHQLRLVDGTSFLSPGGGPISFCRCKI